MKLDAATAQAILNLRVSNDFRVFMEAVRKYEVDTVKSAISADGDVSTRAKGKAQALRTLIDWVDEAPAVLERFKSNPNAK